VKDFIRPKGRLRALSFHARLAYTTFLAFTLAGVVLTAWLLDDMVGMEAQGVEEYYAGGSAAAGGDDFAPAADGDGPMLELPDEGLELAPVAAISLRKLLEVTHFHLFTMPVYLLILSHLFMLSRLGSGFKTATIGAGGVGTALHIAAPWAAAKGTAGSVALYAVSGTMMAGAYLVMCLLPIWEMWTPEPSRRRADASQRELSPAAAKARSALG